MWSRYSVSASRRCWHSDWAPWQVEQMFIIGSAGLLGEREGARVQRVGELLVVLGDHAGARAVGAVELDQLDPEPLGDQRHRAVQLGGEAAARRSRASRRP